MTECGGNRTQWRDGAARGNWGSGGEVERAGGGNRGRGFGSAMNTREIREGCVVDGRSVVSVSAGMGGEVGGGVVEGRKRRECF